MESLSLMIDAEYIYNSVVATDREHDEIYSTVSLIYVFKVYFLHDAERYK